MIKLSSCVVDVKEINETILDRMYKLMCSAYHGTSRDKITKDLSNKQYVLLLSDENKILQGFTTMQIFDSIFRNKTVKIIYSGDTIINKEARGDLELMRAWWKFACSIQNKFPQQDIYWMLISKGWRTYKFFPLFFKEFYPSKEMKTPQEFQDFIDRLGTFKFPDEYQNGIVIPKFPDFLIDAQNDVPFYKQDDADIQFFLKQNPGFIKGNELVCVTHLSPDNLTKTGVRLLNGGISSK